MWQEEWLALTARIEGLRLATMLVIQAGAPQREYPASKYLIREMNEIAGAIETFESAHRDLLPTNAGSRLQTLITEHRNDLRGYANGFAQVQIGVPALVALRGEMDYLLRDIEVTGRSLVERAFQHLQRSIVADPIIRETWRKAFNESETACERLGACHLLLHGIWAFKANAAGERTDLVLGTPLQITPAIRAAADVFVLTEWKKVSPLGQQAEQYRQAVSQAKRYCSGVLAGFELSCRRFLVLVSEDVLAVPQPVVENALTYECLNVAVNPSTPSKSAHL